MNFKKNIKIILPLCVILIVAVSVAAAFITREEAVVANETAETIPTEETVAAIGADNPLEADKYPELNALIEKYLTALADGDVEAIGSITNNMTDIERIRVEELSKYIDAFPTYNVFSKLGPAEGSYIVYAAARAQFPGVEELVPGIYCFYVCADENGGFYFNEGTLTEEEQVYIDAINADASVVSLLDSIDKEYQELLDSDENLATYIEIMQSEIRGAVGQALANVSAESQPVVVDEGASDPTVLKYACKARTTDTINVRSSDSETADKLGKLQKGTEIDIVEIRVNGWSKINFEGQEAYVKTDYLEVLENE